MNDRTKQLKDIEDALLHNLIVLVAEWDAVIKAPASGIYEQGHEAGMILCRDELAKLINIDRLRK